VGDPVDAAVAEGRQAMYAVDRLSSEWATPVLFLRTPTGELYPEGDVWDPSALRKRTRLRWIAGLLALFLAGGVGVVVRNWLVEPVVTKGAAPASSFHPKPPPSNEIEVTGIGFPPSGIGGERGKFLARRAAEVDARRKLAEIIEARLVSETKVTQGEPSTDTALMTVDEFVRGARVIAERVLPEGGYEVRMSASIRPKENP